MSRIEAEAVKQALLDRAEDLFRAAWGEPVKPGAKDWRARESSGLRMTMRGRKRGAWSDFKAGLHGDVLDFYGVQFCGLTRARDDFPRVIEDAAAWCGLSRDKAPDLSGLQARRAAQRAQDAIAETREAEDKARQVAALQARSAAVAGSPAAAYLAARGVVELPPAGVAYLPPVPGLGVLSPERGALVIWATDDAGQVRGGQRVLILPDGGKAPEDVRKPAFGAIAGFPARFPARIEDGPLLVCEGPETALSVWQVTGCETWAVFGATFFETAPIPTDRQVILCPDRDAADSSAGKAFRRAVAHHAERGCDLWIAEAPEPEGSKADLNDTLQRAGAAAVRDAIAAARQVPAFARAADGRFTGRGAVPADPVALPDFLTVAEAGEVIRDRLGNWFRKVLEWTAEDGPAPVLALAAYPGTGKSRIAREELARVLPDLVAGDVLFHAPTLALAEEAAAHAASLGAGDHVTRGRSAKPAGVPVLGKTPANPGPTMCARADLAERVAKAGKRVFPSLCERVTPEGEPVRCPHFDGCTYLRQWASLGEGPVLRFEAHAYLSLPGDGSQRKTALRVIDESLLGQFTRKADLPLDRWLRPRWPAGGKGKRAEADAAARAADATQAAAEVLQALQEGRSPVLDGYTAEDFEAFRDAERGGDVLTTSPAADDLDLAAELAAVEPDSDAGKRAAVWAILADCRRRGLPVTERLRLVRDVPSPGTGERRDVIRATWLAEAPRDAPVLILDADADPEILDRLYPGAELVRFDVRPNAHVVQVTDATFSKAAILGPKAAPKDKAARQDLVDLIRAEVLRDRLSGGRGVLVVASRKIVRQMFADAGHDFADMPEAQVSDAMRETVLHGARWLWFGPASLGRNDWQDFGTAVVIGREELALSDLQDMGRAVFGDAGEPLAVIEERPGANMPEALVPYAMADGTGQAVKVRLHPDRRIAALQRQFREGATRQAFERLRLATAAERKRVVLACNVPIPGLPVDELVTWADLRPTRLQAAIAEAAQRGGVLRLSAAGLAADAPETFPSGKAAERWIEGDGKGAFNTPMPLIEHTISGVGVFNPVRVRVRIEGQRGKATPALIVLPGDPRALAEAQLGHLAGFELVDPAPAVVVPPAALEWSRAAKAQPPDPVADPPAVVPAPVVKAGNLALQAVPAARPVRRLVRLADPVPLRSLGEPLRRYRVTAAGAVLTWARGVAAALADWQALDDPGNPDAFA